MLLARIGSASLNIFLSFVLATAAIVALAVLAPAVVDKVYDFAQIVERWLTGTDLPVRYNFWVRWLINAQQLTFIFFVILARIVLTIVFTLAMAPFRKKKTRTYTVKK